MPRPDARFRAIIGHLPEAVAVLAPIRQLDGRIVDFRLDYANPAAGRLPWTPLASRPEQTLLDLHPELENSPLIEEFRAVIEHDEALEPRVERALPLPDREPSNAFYEVRAFNVDGELAVFWRDVSNRHRAEQALRESEAVLRAAFEYAAVAKVLLDEEARCVRVNSVLCRLLGYGEDELVGSTFGRFVHPSDRPALLGEEGLLAANEQGQQGEIRCLHRDGRVVSTLATCAAVGLSGKQPFSHVLQLVDITSLKQAEAELAQSNADLEQFAYVVSHDLQEPLRMVSGYLQLLERRYIGDLPPEAREFIEFAVGGANRMRDLIKDLLAYSRVTTRGEPFQACDLNDILESVRLNLEVAIEESGAVIEAGDLPVVHGDPIQLAQALQNLLANAIKFAAKDRPPRITVEGQVEAGEARLTVADNGIGIDPKYHEVIFQPFRRLHSRDEYPGSGMGLTIVQRIAQRHGGEVHTTGQPGEGARFVLTLPMPQRASRAGD
ncbi:MAG: PAS domain S-box protein [Armatimonadetes bacterium]|nr:PAS domain S-box protein [Armatimonadota bacterium]